MSRPKNKDLFIAAVRLARQGVPVFPCHWEGDKAKRPLTKNGFLDASTDEDQIKRWWKQHPGAGIGSPSGNKWDVLDVAVRDDKDGTVHLAYLQRVGLLNGCKRVVATPSGGYHLYFNANPLLNNKTRANLGLDVRASGGYVLAPPSYIETDDYAGSYTDLGETSGSTDDPLLWDDILMAIAPENEETKKPVSLLRVEERANIVFLRAWLLERQAGERNHSLHWAAWRCVESGIDPHELTEAAIEVGLDEDEIAKTIGSVLKKAGITDGDLVSEAEALFGDD